MASAFRTRPVPAIVGRCVSPRCRARALWTIYVHFILGRFMSTASPRPFLSLWFGNFFEPFYSNAAATKAGIADAADLGFTSINLDSKAWRDFFDRYEGKSASTYVAMQELMMSEAARLGLDYTCLALYLCGDNLYPSIRDVAPVRGEEPSRPDGSPMGTYKYWSPVAQDSMVEHVRGLLRLYGAGMHRTPGGQVVIQTMFDPIPKPSFDEEGRTKYLSWLAARYDGDISNLHQRYALDAAHFDALTPQEYWLRPDELNWVGCARPSTADFAKRTPDFYRWVDNQTHLAEVLQDYLRAMRRRWNELDTDLFVEPVLHQWGYFFNPPGEPDWQTGQRALDVYKCAEHVDGALFIASPLNAENRPDAMALSVEGAIARCANAGRTFTGGLYLGRHINQDIYRTVPPGEAIATHVATGASRIHAYGYSGLDDGGGVFRMEEPFRQSLRAGNAWAAHVMPLLEGEERAKEVAILFPAEMSLLEPLEVDTDGRHRMDLLGWYEQFTDAGWHVDIVHPDQVVAGALRDYHHLVVPTNSLYDLAHDTARDALEASVLAFVEGGGTVFHGPGCTLAQSAFGVVEQEHPFDCIAWHEDVIPHGWSTVWFDTGTA